MSRYDGADSYVYPGNRVLRNKADIRDAATLNAFEADASAVRMLELADHPIEGPFDLPHLCAIHRTGDLVYHRCERECQRR
jgi:cell filamentation protein